MKSIYEYFPKEGFVGDLEVHLCSLKTDGTRLTDTTVTYQFDENPTVQIELPIDMVKSVVKPKSTEGAEPVEEAEQQLEEKTGSCWQGLLDRINEIKATTSKDNEAMEDVVKQLKEECSKQAEYLEKTTEEGSLKFVLQKRGKEELEERYKGDVQAAMELQEKYDELKSEVVQLMMFIYEYEHDGRIRMNVESSNFEVKYCYIHIFDAIKQGRFLREK
jgi:vacuolar-type H+-ATPase subunit I/STV1